MLKVLYSEHNNTLIQTNRTANDHVRERLNEAPGRSSQNAGGPIGFCGNDYRSCL